VIVSSTALEPKDGSVVVAVFDGELTIKALGPCPPPGTALEPFTCGTASDPVV